MSTTNEATAILARARAKAMPGSLAQKKANALAALFDEVLTSLSAAGWNVLRTPDCPKSSVLISIDGVPRKITLQDANESDGIAIIPHTDEVEGDKFIMKCGAALTPVLAYDPDLDRFVVPENKASAATAVAAVIAWVIEQEVVEVCRYIVEPGDTPAAG